ncbi:MAG: hypothetical protein LBH46_02765 [Rickettsiales bacterium]|jgi:hypothetical protein|nr:hypothetical protein [Rickettsiales bacterium]
MGKLLKIKVLYNFLKLLLLFLIIKICYDFVILNKDYENNVSIVNDNIIIEPRFQTTEKFNYIRAKKGIVLNKKDEYEFFNVNIIGNYGNGSADKLVIKDKILNFEGNIDIHYNE